MDLSIGSVMNKLFGSAPTSNAPPVNPVVVQNANPSQVANPTQPLPGVAPSSSVMAPNGIVPEAPPASPLDAFKDIWNTPPTDPNAPAPQSMFANMDPKKVLESARKVDFSSTLTPELMARVAKGGEDGVRALTEAMSHVGQNVYAQNASATAKIVEQALAKQSEQFNANLPSLVRKFSANENLRTDNTLLAHPAIAPLVPAATEMFQRKNPNATTAEIESQVSGYFKAMGQAFAPASLQTEAQRLSQANETDWSKFLG